MPDMTLDELTPLVPKAAVNTVKMLYGAITQISPMQVLIDGDTAPTPVISCIEIGAAVGQRVAMLLQDRILIAIGAVGGVAGTPVPLLEVEYSQDTLTWYDNPTGSDIYIRTSNDGGMTWSAPLRIKGDTGAAGAVGPTGPAGASGADGHTYFLLITGGVRTVVYDASGSNPTPAQTAFGCTLYQDGAAVTPSSYAWSATGLLSGSGTAATFTPTVNAAFSAAQSNTVALSVTYAGMTFSAVAPVAATRIGGVANKVYWAQPAPPYTAGDMWMDGGIIHQCTTSRASGSYTAGDWALFALVADYVKANISMTSPTINGGHIIGALIDGGDVHASGLFGNRAAIGIVVETTPEDGYSECSGNYTSGGSGWRTITNSTYFPGITLSNVKAGDEVHLEGMLRASGTTYSFGLKVTADGSIKRWFEAVGKASGESSPVPRAVWVADADYSSVVIEPIIWTSASTTMTVLGRSSYETYCWMWAKLNRRTALPDVTI